MSSKASTVVALKTKFLRDQVKILSQPLQTDPRDRDERSHVRESSIAEATREVNRMVKRHNQAVFSELAIRHVAEQIDSLYWDMGAANHPDRDQEATLEGQDPTVRLGDDLSRDEVIAKLPTTPADIDDIRTTQDSDSQIELYQTTLEHLRILSQHRAAIQKKTDALRRLGSVLAPFQNPDQNVQPNLFTREGKLAKELVKARELSVRVGARISTLEGEGNAALPNKDVEMDFPEDQDGRLQRAWDAT